MAALYWADRTRATQPRLSHRSVPPAGRSLVQGMVWCCTNLYVSSARCHFCTANKVDMKPPCSAGNSMHVVYAVLPSSSTVTSGSATVIPVGLASCIKQDSHASRRPPCCITAVTDVSYSTGSFFVIKTSCNMTSNLPSVKA